MPQGFGPLGDRPALRRLASLKWRTFVVAAVAASGLAGGAFLLAPPLQGLFSWLYWLTAGHGGMLALHLPSGLTHSALHEQLQAVFVLMALMGVAGLSSGAFGRTRAAVVAVVPLLLAGLTLWSLPPSSRWMHVVPSQLERRILQADWPAARAIVASADGSPFVKDYVLAQVALRGNDKAGLAAHGEPVLAFVDRFVYGLPLSDAERAALPDTVNFEPEVLQALDVALHQQPETEIGIGWQASLRSGGWLQSALPALALGLRLALGAGLLAGALALARLWNTMRNRVSRIHAELQPAAPDFTELRISPVADSEPEPARTLPVTLAPSASKTSPEKPGRLTAEGKPPRRTRPPEQPRRSGKRAAWIITALLAGAGVPVLVWHHAGSASKTSSARTGSTDPAARWPCRFVGSWTSARAESVYKVTLGEDGGYAAEPIASGRYSATSFRGKWQVDGNRIQWDDSARSGKPADINDVLESKPKSFSLREVNGEVTHFNLIQALSTGRCAR